MWRKLKIIVFVTIALTAVWLLLTHHIIFIGYSPKILKKISITSDYTFVSIDIGDPGGAMIIDRLREAGLGDLLVQTGVIDKKEKEEMEARYSNDSIYY